VIFADHRFGEKAAVRQNEMSQQSLVSVTVPDGRIGWIRTQNYFPTFQQLPGAGRRFDRSGLRFSVSVSHFRRIHADYSHRIGDAGIHKTDLHRIAVNDLSNLHGQIAG